MSSKLLAAIDSVNWDENSKWLSTNLDFAERIEACNSKIAIWARQLEVNDKGVVALSFVREMQRAGHQVACCLALAMYKPAAAAMRSMVECAFYYAYFRTHEVELHTLVRDDKYFVSKAELLDYFKLHIVGYKKKQEKLNFAANINGWYSKTSAIVHGQIPGVWSQGGAVADFVHTRELIGDAIAHFEVGVSLVRDLFFCTLAEELWHGFSATAKREILRGISADVRTVLVLDMA